MKYGLIAGDGRFRPLALESAIERIRNEVPACEEIEELLDFIQSSQRGVIKG